MISEDRKKRPDWSSGLCIRQAGNGGWIVELMHRSNLLPTAVAALSDEAALLKALPAILAGEFSE